MTGPPLQKKLPMKYAFNVRIKGKTIQMYHSANKRRFCNQTRTINWLELRRKDGSVSLRVNYGKLLDNFGKMTLFLNEGVYKTRKDFERAFNAFCEK